ncbi:hypothetical protein JTB14_030315 [Gonioctena quinquepunctata]|nr:hypothetical protein JTB14_030315 [Gonioctena quinquepunctata]
MGILWRKRSLLLKLVVIVGTAWFTISFLLYTDNSDRSRNGAAMRLESGPIRRDNSIINEESLPRRVVPFRKETTRTEMLVRKQDDDNVLLPPQNMAGEMGKPVFLPSNLSGELVE